MPRPSGQARFPAKFVVLGAFQTALSLFVGVSGPLNMPFLLRENLGRDRTVITHGTQMTVMHTLKVILFGVLGGALAFGMLGVFIGPVLLTVFYELARSWIFFPKTLPPEAVTIESEKSE